MSGHKRTGATITIAVSLLSAVLGSVHAFSVFITPLETQFDASRSSVSLTYSLALVSLTAAVLLGHRLYARWSAAQFVLASALLAAAGSTLAALGTSLPMVWLGYSLLFGAANGLGYGFGLQIAAQANPGKEGLAMGIVTAAYALGAVMAPAPFEHMIDVGGVSAALFGLAGTLVIVGGAAAWLLSLARAQYATAATNEKAALRLPINALGLMWLGYFGGVMAGLMVIGHATGIAETQRPGTAAWLAPTVLATCNLSGSLIGGRTADMVSPRLLLTILPGLTVATLIVLSIWSGPGTVLVCLGLIGFTYGSTIAAYPSVIAKRVGPEASARVYGQVFTAWGAAGLAGPWLAGFLFDLTEAYLLAPLVAAAIAAVSIIAAYAVFDSDRV